MIHKSLRLGVDSNSSKYQSNQHSQSSLHSKHSKEKSRNSSMASDAFDMPQQLANKKSEKKRKRNKSHQIIISSTNNIMHERDTLLNLTANSNSYSNSNENQNDNSHKNIHTCSITNAPSIESPAQATIIENSSSDDDNDDDNLISIMNSMNEEIMPNQTLETPVAQAPTQLHISRGASRTSSQNTTKQASLASDSMIAVFSQMFNEKQHSELQKVFPNKSDNDKNSIGCGYPS